MQTELHKGPCYIVEGYDHANQVWIGEVFSIEDEDKARALYKRGGMSMGFKPKGFDPEDEGFLPTQPYPAEKFWNQISQWKGNWEGNMG